MIRAIRSLRVLRRQWKLSLIAALSLSIAMALGVLSLSVLNTFLLLPPSGAAPDRLVMIYAQGPGKPLDQISYPDYKYFRDNNRVFTDIAAAPDSIGFRESKDKNHEIKVLSRPVSSNYFAVLGLRPFLGRLFGPGDDQTKTPIAVMTYTCWKRLGADPKIVGKTIAGRTIVGITGREFTGSLFGLNGDLLEPLFANDNNPLWRTERDARRLFLLARLKPGVSRRQAQADLEALSGQLASAYPKDDKGRIAVLTRATLLPPDLIQPAELITGLLTAIVLLVLLIACANVANLLLAVAAGRRQEAAIKLALGVSRRRLIREFLRESTAICVVSGAVGYGLAALAIARWSNLSIPLPMVGAIPLAFNFHLDATVAGFTVLLMLIAILATGLAPALYASSPGLAQILSGEIVAGGKGKRRWRSALVVVQVAVSTLVLVGMGLCQRSLHNLRHADPGFSARNLVGMTIYPGQEGYSEPRAKELYGNLRRSVSALPGVEAVTLASNLPLVGLSQTPVQFAGEDKKISIGSIVVDTDFFSTFRYRILDGRVFNSSDREGGVDALVINRKMAETFWPGREAVGQSVLTGDPARRGVVVGVVNDGKYGDLDEATQPFLYYALSQHYQDSINIVARTAGDPSLWVEPLARVMRNAGIASVFRPQTFDNWINLTLTGERMAAAAVAALSALGLLLAVVGLFGAISYSVSERRKELGIRVALGARPWQLLKMILRQTLSIVGAGVVIGLLLGIGAAVLLRSEFYRISAVEWTVLAPVAVAMLAVSLVVAWLSARSWIRIDPMEAVRHI